MSCVVPELSCLWMLFHLGYLLPSEQCGSWASESQENLLSQQKNNIVVKFEGCWAT